MSNVKRDSTSGAIVNTDVSALNKYKVERNYYRKVDKLQDDILEIKRSIISIYERIEKLENK
tara:strand:+ start:212 stop:397 length:186 start_codon:yes stop_codon:yes gene_type:complete